MTLGSQYRSNHPLFECRAEGCGREVRAEAQKGYSDPITTEIVPLVKFWPAEDYHQDYFAKHPDEGYCSVVIRPEGQQAEEAFGYREAVGSESLLAEFAARPAPRAQIEFAGCLVCRQNRSMSGWMGDLGRLTWGMLYWNLRKSIFRFRGGSSAPCQHPSDSGVAGRDCLRGVPGVEGHRQVQAPLPAPHNLGRWKAGMLGVGGRRAAVLGASHHFLWRDGRGRRCPGHICSLRDIPRHRLPRAAARRRVAAGMA